MIPGVATHCPDTCGTCDTCVDGTLKFKFVLNEEILGKKCSFFERKPKRCSKVDGVKDTCRLSCENCSDSDTLAPTKAPTTSAPTKTPTTSAPTQEGATAAPVVPTTVPTATPTASPSGVPSKASSAQPSGTAAPTFVCVDNHADLCAEWASCCEPDKGFMTTWCPVTCGYCRN